MESSNTNNNITLCTKMVSHCYYKFFINKQYKHYDNLYLQNFLALPSIPLVGHYQHSNYSFGNVLLHVTFTYDLLFDKGIANTYEDFVPPVNITEYLNINEHIDIDNNTKYNKHNSVMFVPKEKINFHFVITTLPDDNGVSKDKTKFNIVPHLFYVGNDAILKENQKRREFEYPITLFVDDNNQHVIKQDKSKFGIDFNNLRLEYNSVHIKGGGLAFSPNNLQFEINKQYIGSVNDFYVVVCQKEKEYHSVFYYVVIGNKYQKDISDLCDKATNIKEVIEGLDTIIKAVNDDDVSKQTLNHIKQLFKV